MIYAFSREIYAYFASDEEYSPGENEHERTTSEKHRRRNGAMEKEERERGKGTAREFVIKTMRADCGIVMVMEIWLSIASTFFCILRKPRVRNEDKC